MTLSEPRVTAEQSARRPRHFIHIRELDGIRGAAALMVFFHHVCFASIPESGWPAPISLLRYLSIGGRYGVDVFFVLSGFLISSLLLDARRDRSYYHDFYWKRILRILPLYVICLLGVGLFIPGSWRFVLLSALFLSNFAGLFHIPAGGPFWTLAIEEQFYLLWPRVIRFHSVDQIRRWSATIAVGCVALRIIAACFGHFNYNFTFFHCDGLAVGAFLACWHYERSAAVTVSSRAGKIIAAACLAGILLTALPTSGHQIIFTALRAAAIQTGVTLISGSVIAAAILLSGKRILAPLRSRLLTFFGLISYAMYMIHAYVMEEYDRLRGAVIPGDVLAFAVRFATILAATIALCMISRYLIELPAISLRRYVIRHPSIPAPEDPPIPLGNI